MGKFIKLKASFILIFLQNIGNFSGKNFDFKICMKCINSVLTFEILLK